MNSNNRILHLNATVGELDMFSPAFDYLTPIKKILLYFEQYKEPPGIIILKEKAIFGMVSRFQMYRLLSKPYMRELYADKTIEFFYNENFLNPGLIVSAEMSIPEAAEKALLREEKQRNEPVLVVCGNESYKLLDFYSLLLAQAQIHIQILESLNEANEFKKEVLAVVAHDLKNPIGNILAFTQILNDDNAISPDNKNFINYIKESAHNILGIITDLLDSAVKGNSKNSLNTSRFDVFALVKSIISSFSKQAASKLQNLIARFDNDYSFEILADKIKLREAFENLISNAIKYSPPQKEIDVDLYIENNILFFSVKDNGPGLTDEDKQKIFGKFQRLSAQPTGNESSTGLGLYIVKNIIEMHGGKIEVESTVNCGSEFVIQIPVTNNKSHKNLNYKNAKL